MIPPPTGNKRRSKRFRRLLLIGSAGVLCLLAADQIWIRVNQHISLGHDTTRVSEPLAKDGLPDYMAALNRRLSDGVTSENNAAPMILQITGTAEGTSAWIDFVRDKFELGNKPISITPTYHEYVLWFLNQVAATSPSPELNAAMRDDLGELSHSRSEQIRGEIIADLEQAAAIPWSALDYPRRAKWLELNAPALKLLESACQRPRFYMPILTKNGRLSNDDDLFMAGPWVPGAGYYMQLGYAILSRAMLCMNGGDFVGYRRDVATCLAFSRLIAQNPQPFVYLKAIRMRAFALKSVYGNLSRLSEEQVRSMFELIANAEPLRSPAEIFDLMERYEILDMFLDARTNGFRGRFFNDGSAKVLLHVVPFNFAAGMRTANRVMDAYVTVGDLPTFVQQKAALKKISSEVDGFGKLGGIQDTLRLHECYLGQIILPSAGRVFELHRANGVSEDLTRIALRLRLAKLDTGAYPDSLKGLDAVEFKIPADRFSEAPYIYRRVGEGFLLYSVGPNSQDDGGIATSEKIDDITVQANR